MTAKKTMEKKKEEVKVKSYITTSIQGSRIQAGCPIILYIF